jgi:hypothetical protein
MHILVCSFCLLFLLPQSHLAMVSARADFDSSKTDRLLEVWSYHCREESEAAVLEWVNRLLRFLESDVPVSVKVSIFRIDTSCTINLAGQVCWCFFYKDCYFDMLLVTLCASIFFCKGVCWRVIQILCQHIVHLVTKCLWASQASGYRKNRSKLTI